MSGRNVKFSIGGSKEVHLSLKSGVESEIGVCRHRTPLTEEIYPRRRLDRDDGTAVLSCC